MKVKNSPIGKKLIANKGLQNAIYAIIGIILFGAFLLIKNGALEGILPTAVIFVILVFVSMMKIAWEEFNPEKAAKFKWIWEKMFEYFNIGKKIKVELDPMRTYTN